MGSGVVLVLVGDCYFDVGRKLVRYGGGWLSVRLLIFSLVWLGNFVVIDWVIVLDCGKNINVCLMLLW